MKSGVAQAQVQEEGHGWPGAEVWRSLWGNASRLLRKVKIQRRPKELRIRETTPLGDRKFLALVEWKNERLLLGVTPGAITLLKTQASGATQAAEMEERSEG